MDSSGANSQRRFDLFEQPFRVLRVDPWTPVEDVNDAARLAEAEPDASDDAQRARNFLLDPTLRLSFELTFPLDCPGSEVEAFYACLGSDASTDGLVQFSDRLWPLARANFLAHIASHRAATGKLLFELIRSHAAIDPTDIHVKVRTARTFAGIPEPSFLSINEGLTGLRKRHADAAFVGYDAVQDAAAPMLECTLHGLATDERHCNRALGRLLRSYRQASEPLRVGACHRIESTCAALLQEPGSLTAIQEIQEAAKAWASLSTPFLLWNADQPERKLTIDTPVACLRGLLKTLCANKHYEIAQDVMAATREIFAAVPTTLDQLAEDARLVTILSAHTNIKQLESALREADRDPGPLITALVSTGFGEASAEPAKRLWNGFVSATRSSTETASSPWRLIHDFAIRFSNRPEAAAAVIALIEGLIRYGESAAAPPRTLRELRDNLHFMQSFVGHEPATDGAAASRFSATGTSKPGAFATAFSWLRRSGSEPRFSRMRHWRKPLLAGGLIAAIAFCATVLYVGYGRFSLGSSEVSAATNGLAAASLGAQTIPPVGTGQHLAIEGVRYCHFQQERLRSIKRLIKRPEDARAYNLLIVDYNSRCSDFFYRDEDLKLVEAEVEANKDLFEADARRILASWPGHGTEASKNE